MAREDCMYRVTWKAKYGDGVDIFFSESQVKAFLRKMKSIISYTVEKIK